MGTIHFWSGFGALFILTMLVMVIKAAYKETKRKRQGHELCIQRSPLSFEFKKDVFIGIYYATLFGMFGGIAGIIVKFFWPVLMHEL